MESTKAKYGLSRNIADLPFEEARERVIEALSKVGFGIISEIDMRKILREKIGVDFQPYLILGACNAALAYDGLMREPGLGLMLPCNVVITPSESGGTLVTAMDPYAIVKITENFEIEDVATEAREKLKKAIGSI